MKIRLLISVIGWVLAGLTAQLVRATPYVVTLTEQNTNVVAYGSGAIELAGLVFPQSYTSYLPDSNGHLFQSFGAVATGSEIIFNSNVIDVYSGNLSGPTNFGSGSSVMDAKGSAGDFVQVLDYAAAIAVPIGYVSERALSNTSTWNNASFASFGADSRFLCLDLGFGGKSKLHARCAGARFA